MEQINCKIIVFDGLVLNTTHTVLSILCKLINLELQITIFPSDQIQFVSDGSINLF